MIDLPELNKRTVVESYSLCLFYEAKGYGDNPHYHRYIWRPYLANEFFENNLLYFDYNKSPKTPLDELINEFLDAYPELNGSVTFYYS